MAAAAGAAAMVSKKLAPTAHCLLKVLGHCHGLKRETSLTFRHHHHHHQQQQQQQQHWQCWAFGVCGSSVKVKRKLLGGQIDVKIKLLLGRAY